jgi:gluconokinase
MWFLIVMGVAGCGKSSLARVVAEAMDLPLIEGDDFHPAWSKDKMRRGIPLSDADRAGWLDALAHEMRVHAAGAVLTCSALKRSYRDRLREQIPGVRFVFLRIEQAVAHDRVAARAAEHLFPPSLVRSQFDALEPPHGEDGVLNLDATAPLDELAHRTLRWFRSGGA